MALFFTPALTALIGHAAWWPGHGDSRPEGGSGSGKVLDFGGRRQSAEADRDEEYDSSGSLR